MSRFTFGDLLLSFGLMLFVTGIASAQTTVYTYQGRLNDGANPANGNYEMQFRMFDTPTVGTGTQYGPTVTGTVMVNAGVFSAPFDWGPAPFSGPPRYFEIAVRPAGSPNAFTILSPRSLITSTPFAIRSLNSSVADTLSSACVECISGTQIASLPLTSTANTFNATAQFSIGGTRILSAPGTNNLFAGPGAGSVNSVGTDNSFFGKSAGLVNSSGSQNAFFGSFAGSSNTSGASNSFFGMQAGASNTTAGENSFFGTSAGAQNTTGASNSFFGSGAGVFNTTGNGNSFFGVSAGGSGNGSYNSFFGSLAGYGNTTGKQNAFFGQVTGLNNTSGDGNAFFGSNVGTNNTTGVNNLFAGFMAGAANATGSNNTLIGANTNVGSSAINFATAIGAGAVVFASNSVMLGRAADTVVVPGYLNVMGTLSAHTYSIDNTAIILSAPGSLFNTVLGVGAGITLGGLTHATAIGADTIASQSNSVFIGRADGSDVVRIPGATVINGTLVVGSLGSAGSTSVCLNAVNRFAPCSSSLRYKTSVQTFSRGLDIVRRLRPITFDWKEGGMHDVGFGAEEVNEIEPLLTTRNSSGEIEGVKYSQITTVLVNAVKEQQVEIEAQRKQIAEQQKQIQSQQKLLDAVKRLVCSQNRNADVCKEEPK